MITPHPSQQSRDTSRGHDKEPSQVRRRADHQDLEGAGRPSSDGRSVHKHGISSTTFCKWKAKYGGLEVSDACNLKALEDENAELKKLLAEAMVDHAILKDIAAKKW